MFFKFQQEKIHVLPNLRILQKALRNGEGKVAQMNIPEYLVHASKRYCNYKAIVAAIEQSCDDVDVKCYLVIILGHTSGLAITELNFILHSTGSRWSNRNGEHSSSHYCKQTADEW